MMDETTAREFLRFCVKVLGQGFHPDTEFADYVTNNGAPVFRSTTAEHLDEIVTDAMAALILAGVDPYAIVINIMLENAT
jgi:hypothetical protein